MRAGAESFFELGKEELSGYHPLHVEEISYNQTNDQRDRYQPGAEPGWQRQIRYPHGHPFL